jgi:pimeloyl-ACP methyl ester carboxylesterase
LRQRVSGNVLLVHGFGGSTYSWRHNVNALQQAGFNVLAVDLPAFGYSDRPPQMNHSNSKRAQLLWGLIDSITSNKTHNTPRNWHFVGHSMGASVIIAMEQLRPQRTASLALVDGAVFEAKSTQAKITDFFLSWSPLPWLIQYVADRHFLTYDQIEHTLTQAYGYPPDSNTVKNYLTPLQREGTIDNIIQMAASYDQRPLKLSEISSPTYLIWGENDSWIPLEYAKKVKKKIYNARFVTLSEAAHCPMETHPTNFNR